MVGTDLVIVSRSACGSRDHASKVLALGVNWRE